MNVYFVYTGLNKQKALWNIERGQHHSVLSTSRLDNMMLVTALLLLGYFPLFNFYNRHLVSRELIYAYPIISSVASAIISFDTMVNAVYGYEFNKLGHLQLQRMQIPTFNDTPYWFLSTSFIRTLAVPVCVQLFWAFSMTDFGVGPAYYTIPCIVVGELAVLVLAQVWAYYTSPTIYPPPG